jgi:hypothetical protein
LVRILYWFLCLGQLLTCAQVVFDKSNSTSVGLYVVGSFRCSCVLAHSCRVFLRLVLFDNAKTDTVSVFLPSFFIHC